MVSVLHYNIVKEAPKLTCKLQNCRCLDLQQKQQLHHCHIQPSNQPWVWWLNNTGKWANIGILRKENLPYIHYSCHTLQKLRLLPRKKSALHKQNYPHFNLIWRRIKHSYWNERYFSWWSTKMISDMIFYGSFHFLSFILWSKSPKTKNAMSCLSSFHIKKSTFCLFFSFFGHFDQKTKNGMKPTLVVVALRR